MNRVTLMGRLVATPELKTTTSGISVTAFAVAVQRKYSSNGERQSDFIDVVAWRGTAEFICKYFTKGQMIAIDGTLQTRMWEDKNGNKRKSVEVIVDNAFFCGGKNESSNGNNGFSNNGNNNGYAPSMPDFDNIDADDYEIVTGDDDLPF